jgi:YesN/AraC family two-component response regulator
MSKKTIVCIDDEKIVLDSLKNELKESIGNEFAIEVAESGEEALDLIKEFIEDNIEIPVVISDYLMPKMKGDEVLIKIHELLPKTLTLMLTGQATLEGVGNAINNAKLYRYVAKPWEANDLMLTVREACNSYMKDKQIKERVEKLKEMAKLLSEKSKEQGTQINKEAEQISLEAKQSILTFTNTFIDFIQDKNQPVYEKTLRIKKLVNDITESLELNDGWEYEIAALFSHLACFSYTKETALWFFSGEKMGFVDLQKIQEHNKETFELLKNNQMLDNAAKAILYIYDNNEHVKKVSSAKTASIHKVLSIVNDYDNLILLKNTPAEALDILKADSGKYDNDILTCLIKMII